ncbi:MAG: hypothetical protein EU516_00260 [Promethearchaeota archaeon]|nr:MAG: hypothetical protein EU516_00260 [Candidatus Lokiarchaeota archaeon]
MKNINTKALMVVVLLTASVLATPMMVSGYDYEDEYIYDQFGITDPSQLITSFQGFGNIFGGLGYAGNLLGTVFQMLLMQTLTNFSQKQILPGVWEISASIEENHNFTRTFSGEHEIYTVPYEYDQTPINPNVNGYAYCDVVKTGSVEVNVTIGTAVTLIIWDNDGSFIKAVEKLVTFFQRLRIYMNTFSESNIPENLIKEGVSTITWFLIHINDIFTGDELFTINPITWQNVELTPKTFALTKTWRVTGNDWDIDPEEDDLVNSLTNGTVFLENLNNTAKARDDSYMQWLLTPTDILADVTTIWTSFTFDLIQFWMKNFEIHINVAEILSLLNDGGSGPLDVAGIFQGLDIDFYLFTHHLAGAFLYNDTNSDGRISSQYRTLKNSLNETITTPDGTPVEVPDHSEITHRIVLNSVGDFDWKTPELDPSGTKFSWGLDLNNVTITPVPVGVDLESYLGATSYDLDYIHFGFTFEPDTSTYPILKAPTKLDQFFAPWSGAVDSDYDLGIVYLSTVLHFRLNVDVIGEDPTDPATLLDPTDDYNNSTHRLAIGNYIGGSIAPKLEFVDIAGPNYDYGAAPGGDNAPASSSIIPLALYEKEVERHDTFEDSSGMEFQTFATDISLNISFNVFAYAVCFPEFNGGNGIWHDPTFSVYMSFEAQGFWAIILLVAGVGLVGVATILIKRRKDDRF